MPLLTCISGSFSDSCSADKRARPSSLSLMLVSASVSSSEHGSDFISTETKGTIFRGGFGVAGVFAGCFWS